MTFLKRRPHSALKAAQLKTEQPPPELSNAQTPKPSLNNQSMSSTPTVANYPSTHLTLGAGVAIFHLATARVVLCYHSTERYYFLPKGRKDVNEPLTCAAEREGFEESGYRCRLLPLPIATRQPKPHRHREEGKGEEGIGAGFVVEPVWTQLMPVAREVQYILFWYIAETLPPALEVEVSEMEKMKGMAYQTPPAFERSMLLKERIALEVEGYEPVRHENTGVDEEEMLYRSELVSIEDAIQKLGGRGVSADVVRRGWILISRRGEMEEGELKMR